MWSSVFFMIILYVCTLHFTDSALWFQEAVAFGHKTEVRMAVSPLDMLFSHYFKLASVLQSGGWFFWFLRKKREYRGSVWTDSTVTFLSAHKLANVRDCWSASVNRIGDRD